MFKNITRILTGDPHKRAIQRLSSTLLSVNALELEYEKLSSEALRAKTDEYRQKIRQEENDRPLKDILNEILPQAFAAVREASKRTIGLRHYDVQLIGGAELHRGRIAEMRTGEGKTLVATLPLYLNALAGYGSHLITVNDYLARRDARWMAPIYHALGLTVGVLQMASRTENGKKAFLVDLDKTSPHEDQHQLRLVERVEAYLADITYGTNAEYGFDYLRDNLTMRLEDRVQRRDRPHFYAIVDEVDNILIDEARTPLIISGPASDEVEWYVKMAQVVRPLRAPEEVEVNEKDRAVTLTELGETKVEELLGMPFRDPERPEDITPEQARIIGYLEQALRAQFLFRRNKDYLVQSGKVIIIDEFTGRLMPGRRWSEGLHQAVEAKEGVRVEPENVTYATITLQNYFRMYDKLAGMTGTALTESEEFAKIYKLEVISIPTNLEYTVTQPHSELIDARAKDELGYQFDYYTRHDDKKKQPIFWRRKDYPDVVYRSEEAKLRAITREIVQFHIIGRPILVGTTSVEHSERLSLRLQAESIRRLMHFLLIRQVWMEVNKIDYMDRAVNELQPLNLPLPEVESSEMRQLARKLNFSLSLDETENVNRLLTLLNLQPEHKERLGRILQGGIPHQVLNARKHDEESQIIASAGAFGAVTIATNMAGRGVDIKLGGQLADDILAAVIRILSKVGQPDPYNLSNEDRRQALLKLPVEDIGIYEEQVKGFFEYMANMEKVRVLGGLHVIGSERHEARRIDNQLRGRAARQGDPGSSRFYLSLEDELMRLFGGQRVETLFSRLKVDEHMPIEVRILGRLVEESQQRVEGQNFDIRKHLLEYDDVLNTQRKRIYSQRDRVFTKEDLEEDVEEMLETELQERIPKSLQDEGGPWRLLAFLEETQPTIEYQDFIVPSFTYRLLMDDIRQSLPDAGATSSDLRTALINLAERALQAEKEHILKFTRNVLDRAEEMLQQQVKDRTETLDSFIEGLSEDDEAPNRKPAELLQALSEQVRAPLRLPSEQLRQLPKFPPESKKLLLEQIESALLVLVINRAILGIERRLEENTGLRPAQFQEDGWSAFHQTMLQTVEALLNDRIQRLTGDDGQIRRDLEPILDKLDLVGLDERQAMQLLRVIAQGKRLAFDRKTHRQGHMTYNRLNYVYLAARVLEDSPAKQVSTDIIAHLTQARQGMQQVWGRYEWGRLAQAEVTLSQVDERMRKRLIEDLGEEGFNQVSLLPFSSFSPEDQQVVISALGWRVLNEQFRYILLSVISEQWIDYLTRVEALRIAIGLEAYAQRDPLVQYKSRASEMFQQLLADIRYAVISRMFTFQMRRSVATPVEHEESGSQSAPAEQTESTEKASVRKDKKRRRH
jgi:preprotein translocase subunit SecA